MRIDIIKDIILKLPFVEDIVNIQSENDNIKGKVSIKFEELDKSLFFDFIINKQYPFKSYDSETITFFNDELIEYNHVMGNGSICIHTSHNTNLEEKIIIDFNSLKEWINKYYINKENDIKYEHILINEQTVDEKFHSYIFTDVNYKFSKGEFGDVILSLLNQSSYKNRYNLNFIVNRFVTNNSFSIQSNWNSHYLNLKQTNKGFFIFIKEHPAKLKKFAFENWLELKELLPNNFLSFLYEFERMNIQKYKNSLIPIFLGYEITSDEIHWQVALLKIGEFPLKGYPIKINNKKTGTWGSQLISKSINWGISRNSSYKYFFGRGVLSDKITQSKILIIGIGAIGSMVAKTLVKGGCRYIDVVDYDVKEPENVCRSEYLFSTGLTDKTGELMMMMHTNSPFVETNLINDRYFENIKLFSNDETSKRKIAKSINNYDIVFDCTTDDDLMYVLNNIVVKSDIINLSITNHANELVGAFYPNQYNFITKQFNEILNNDISDLYEPTGCWSPTFKASYNDINSLVQLGIKHINRIYKNEKLKNNFIINQDNNTIKIQEF